MSSEYPRRDVCQEGAASTFRDAPMNPHSGCPAQRARQHSKATASRQGRSPQRRKRVSASSQMRYCFKDTLPGVGDPRGAYHPGPCKQSAGKSPPMHCADGTAGVSPAWANQPPWLWWLEEACAIFSTLGEETKHQVPSLVSPTVLGALSRF